MIGNITLAPEITKTKSLPKANCKVTAWGALRSGTLAWSWFWNVAIHQVLPQNFETWNQKEKKTRKKLNSYVISKLKQTKQIKQQKELQHNLKATIQQHTAKERDLQNHHRIFSQLRNPFQLHPWSWSKHWETAMKFNKHNRIIIK